MEKQLANLKPQLLVQIENTKTLEELENFRIQALGKNGSITTMMKKLGSLPAEEKKLAGQLLNEFKTEITSTLETKKKILEEEALNTLLQKDTVDVTLPVRGRAVGKIHPTYQVMEEMLAILAGMGFSVLSGPDIEDDWHNFEALNIPPSHPARQMQATFFLQNCENLLRTQTSGVQIRAMEKQGVPVKIVAPGRTYRVDSDATHSPMFHQIEGLMVDTKTNLAHLKGTLMEFMKLFFETEDIELRFRPSYFQFTEPSFECDVGCERKNGELKIKSGAGWMEVLGCGMVHPNVLKNCGIDPDVYQGFAFGLGMDRFAMLKYGIPHITEFFEGDIRWIKHYGFDPTDIPSLVSGLSRKGK